MMMMICRFFFQIMFQKNKYFDKFLNGIFEFSILTNNSQVIVTSQGNKPALSSEREVEGGLMMMMICRIFSNDVSKNCIKTSILTKKQCEHFMMRNVGDDLK